jgi:hypothetical protein
MGLTRATNATRARPEDTPKKELRTFSVILSAFILGHSWWLFLKVTGCVLKVVRGSARAILNDGKVTARSVSMRRCRAAPFTRSADVVVFSASIPRG